MATDPQTRPIGRRVRRFIKPKFCFLLLLALVVVWLGSSAFVAYRLTRRKQPRFAETPPAIENATVAAIEPLVTDDGETICGWFCDVADARWSVLYLHGNGGSLTGSTTRMRELSRAGCDVLAIALRTHGDSTGETNDFGYSAWREVVEAVAWLERREPDQPIVVNGTSLGASAALFASARLGERVSAYILESPLRDLRTAVWNRLDLYLDWGLEYVACAGLMVAGRLVLPHLDEISPFEAAAGVPPSVPVLILYGAEDRHALPEEATAIAARIGAGARTVAIPGAAHVNLYSVDAALYWKTVVAFLDELATARQRVGIDP